MFITDDGEKISKAEMLASVLSGTGESFFASAARPVLLRLPEHQLAQVDAMAKLSKKSRNAICIDLIDAAIEQVRESLDDSFLSTLDETTFREYAAITAETEDRVQVKG